MPGSSRPSPKWDAQEMTHWGVERKYWNCYLYFLKKLNFINISYASWRWHARPVHMSDSIVSCTCDWRQGVPVSFWSTSLSSYPACTSSSFLWRCHGRQWQNPYWSLWRQHPLLSLCASKEVWRPLLQRSSSKSGNFLEPIKCFHWNKNCVLLCCPFWLWKGGKRGRKQDSKKPCLFVGPSLFLVQLIVTALKQGSSPWGGWRVSLKCRRSLQGFSGKVYWVFNYF